MVNKLYKYSSLRGGEYTIKCKDKAVDIVNRKIFSKINYEKEKIFIEKDDFARWIPDIDDLPSLMASVEFFKSIEKTNEGSELNNQVYQEAQRKMYLLIIKIGDIPGIISAKQGDELGLYLDRVKQQYTPNYHRNTENLSDGLRNLRKWSHQ